MVQVQAHHLLGLGTTSLGVQLFSNLVANETLEAFILSVVGCTSNCIPKFIHGEIKEFELYGKIKFTNCNTELDALVYGILRFS